ncbi:SNARE-LIKE SUPERFAMILY PROTEIN [Salix viminalis]|uniref:SNARE-LIKE SUPERFAMILY PROTEIN n=1 Tax=Salix viminalis TaxID=40686 RepID=A0A9Q0QAH0_SALVM|nr:SNARE-LIKE SUPERFAMILY PROTEIN [Salix viminalis]
MKEKEKEKEKREDASQMHQFILHAALDIVQDLAWTTSAMYLKAIDRFNDMVVSVYVTAGRYRSIDQCVINNAELPTSGSRADSLINNVTSVCRANGLILAKVSMEIVVLNGLEILLNPLYLPGSRITSSHFDTKVRALARKYL